jgi:hypothetical protein
MGTERKAKSLEANIQTNLNFYLNRRIEINNLIENPLNELDFIFNNILKALMWQTIIKISGKPKVRNASYGKNTETKCDLIILTDINEYLISIKKNEDARIISTNSPTDFVKIFSFFKEIIPDDLFLEIEEVSKLIKKIPNYYSYNKLYGNDLHGYINDYIIEGLPSKYKSLTQSIADNLIFKYNSEEEKNKYLDYLHESEKRLRDLFGKIYLEYPEISKRFIHECLTGCHRFNLTENKKGRANLVVDNNSYYFINENDYDNKFILSKIKYGLNNISSSFRLQNVPRKTISKKILNELLLLEKNTTEFILKRNEFCDNFVKADLTFKLI